MNTHKHVTVVTPTLQSFTAGNHTAPREQPPAFLSPENNTARGQFLPKWTLGAWTKKQRSLSSTCQSKKLYCGGGKWYSDFTHPYPTCSVAQPNDISPLGGGEQKSATETCLGLPGTLGSILPTTLSGKAG